MVCYEEGHGSNDYGSGFGMSRSGMEGRECQLQSQVFANDGMIVYRLMSEKVTGVSMLCSHQALWELGETSHGLVLCGQYHTCDAGCL